MNNKVQEVYVETYTGAINLGLKKGYSDQVFKKEEVYLFITNYQIKLIQSYGQYLSASLSEMDIVFAGQVEPHLQIRFILYPRFPMAKDDFKSAIRNLALELMKTFGQNRILVEFSDQTLMLQDSEEIDPRIYN
jgi:hypothetical protein